MILAKSQRKLGMVSRKHYFLESYRVSYKYNVCRIMDGKITGKVSDGSEGLKGRRFYKNGPKNTGVFLFDIFDGG